MPRAVLWGRPLFLIAALGAIAVAITLLVQSQRPRFNVLIITIDTCRADALNDEDTPALMALAARGLRYTKARTPVPLTLPAHASLLTGRDPRDHGLRTNTAPPLAARSVAADFKDAGYATAAFVASSVLHKRYRLDAGFDQYRQPPPPKPGKPSFNTLDAAEQVERVRTWMQARPKGKPYFAWVHLWEPHAPYRPYDGDERRAGTAAMDAPRLRYRGEMRKADWAVEQILKEIDPEKTIVVVTSDHGESFGEHGEPTHGHLCFGATMDIPLIVAGPQVDAGKTDARLCDLTDIAPTLRALCGIESQSGGGGRGLLDLPDARVLVGESLYSYGLYRWAQQTVAYDGRFSLVDGGPAYELFDRAADPGETEPLPDNTTAERVRVHADLDRALVLYRSNAPTGAGTPYSSAGSPYGSVMVDGFGFLPPKKNRALPMVGPRLAATERALNLLNGAINPPNPGAARIGIQAVEAVEAEDRSNPALALARGRALLLVFDRKAEALQALKQAIARGYPRKALQGLIDRCR